MPPPHCLTLVGRIRKHDQVCVFRLRGKHRLGSGHTHWHMEATAAAHAFDTHDLPCFWSAAMFCGCWTANTYVGSQEAATFGKGLDRGPGARNNQSTRTHTDSLRLHWGGSISKRKLAQESWKMTAWNS